MKCPRLFRWFPGGVLAAALVTALPAAAQDVGSLTFEELKAQVTQSDQTTGSMDAGAAMVAEWVDARDLGTESLTVDDLGWVLDRFHDAESGGSAPEEKHFSAKWTGFIEAPATAEYTFSISPFRFRLENSPHFVRQTMRVDIDGTRVIDATGANWQSYAAPIHLEAGRRVPIEVDFEYERSFDGPGSMPPIAALYWESSSVSRSIVPSSVLIPPSGSGNGVLAEYSSLVSEVERNYNRIEPVIDRAWIHGGRLVPRYDEQSGEVVSRLRQELTDSEYFAAWEADLISRELRIPMHELFAEHLRSQDRSQFVQQVLDRPALIATLTWPEVTSLYLAFRAGSPDDVLDLVGRWSQTHPDVEPVFGVPFFTKNRESYRNLAGSVAEELPDHAERLLTQYLTMSDGGCCLPIAYLLAYAHLMQGRITDWMALLDERLADEEITGDRRANWLLARAQAEEIRFVRSDRFVVGREMAMAGREWLEEASLVGQSESAKRRALKELVVRLSSKGAMAAAEKIIKDWEEGLGSPESQAAFEEWRSSIAQISEENQRRIDESRARAVAAYEAVLRSRLQRAIDRGDDDAVDHYNGLLGDIASDSDPSDGPVP